MNLISLAVLTSRIDAGDFSRRGIVAAGRLYLYGPAVCVTSSPPIWVGKFLSSAAHKLFDEIPQRDEFRNKASPPCSSCKQSLRMGRKRLFFNNGDPREALESFRLLIASGRKPADSFLCTALTSCTKTLSPRLGLQVHARLIRSGYEKNMHLGSALVDFYAKHNVLLDARKVFDEMTQPDQVSWTALISGLSQNGRGREAVLLFREMLDTQIKPNCFTYVGVISACAGLDAAVEQVRLLHAHVVLLGFQTNRYIVSSLIYSYSKFGRIEQAVLVFHGITEGDNIIYNAMISGFSCNDHGEEALKLFIGMRNNGIDSTAYTVTSVLNACGSLAVIRQGRMLHSLAIKMGSDGNVFVATALVDMYSKCGSINEAHIVFQHTTQKNSVLWTSLISGYAHNGRGLDAVQLFEHAVTEKGFIPDPVCFIAVLTACSHAGFLDRGIKYFDQMKRDCGLVPQIDHYACLIDLYTRNGQLKKAKELMEEMPCNSDPVIWGSFLSSCAVHGEIKLGKEAAEWLFKMEAFNAAPYATLAKVYAGAGLWGKVAEIWRSMKQKGIKKIAGWSWVEVDNRINTFYCGNTSHPQAWEIYQELQKLRMEMGTATRN